MNNGSLYLQMTRLAWRNVRLNWRHSLSTTVAIATGFIAICFLQGFIADTEAQGINGFSQRSMLGDALLLREGSRLDQNADVWKQAIPVNEQKFMEDFLANDPDVAQRVRFLSIFGMAGQGQHSALYLGSGYDIQAGARMRGERFQHNVVVGEPLTAGKSGALVGILLGNRLGCEGGYIERSKVRMDMPASYAGNLIPLKCPSNHVAFTATTEDGSINQIDLPVAGLLDVGFREAEERLMQMSLPDAQKLLATDKISFVSVALRRPDQLAAFTERFSKAAAAAGFKLEAKTWRSFGMGAQLDAQLHVLRLLNAIFGGIVMVMCIMSVANTMMKSVTERTREIGTLRSVGFFRRHIIYMFCVEGLFISVVASAIGLVATIGLSSVVTWLDSGYTAGLSQTPFPVHVAWVPGTWLACIVVLACLAVAASRLAAKRAAAMVIADAMRFN